MLASAMMACVAISPSERAQITPEIDTVSTVPPCKIRQFYIQNGCNVSDLADILPAGD
jgi:hypothetical protein